MFSFLVLVTLVLGVVAAVQLSKVYQLTAKLRNKREEDISLADNKLNAWLMLIWMIFSFITVIYFYAAYGNYYGENGSFLPVSASAHGVELDWLFYVNIIVITVVFFIVQGALFFCAWKYYYRKDRTAMFLTHNNTAELIWTLVPTVVLAFIIIFGLRVWNSITGDNSSEDTIVVEVYSKQFDWTMRYPGADGILGLSNYNLISDEPLNPLGIVTEDLIDTKIESLDVEIKALEDKLAHERGYLPPDQVEELEDKVYRLGRHILRLRDLAVSKDVANGDVGKGMDDLIVKGELHLPVNKEVEFVFNSRDVIHSAYMPHFRAQMNTVPGQPTRFKMIPTITTDSMRGILEDPKFDYVLLCNKVCGASHNNMAVDIIIESEEEYNKWLEAQKTFDVSINPPADNPEGEENEQEVTDTADGDTAELIKK